MHRVPILTKAVLFTLLLGGCTGSSPEGGDSSGPTLPTAAVEVVVDDAGIPHIYAQNDEDLFFGYGYQLARDRMLQIAMFRRFAYGRLSEVLGDDGPGSVGRDALMDDRFARIFNWKHYGKLDAELMAKEDPAYHALMRAWVAGINARVAEIGSGEVERPWGFGTEGLDRVPEPWIDDDPYVIRKMTQFGLDQTIEYEVFVTFAQRIAPQALEAIELFKPAQPTYILPPSERPQGQRAAAQPKKASRPAKAASAGGFDTDQRLASVRRLSHMKPLGSNSWSIDGQHTENGKPILAGDPHLGYSFSGVTYALHLNSKDAGGSFDVTGFSFVGTPGIFAGHNDKIAWTPTSSFADVMDTWAVRIEDGKAHIGGQLVDVVERVERIGVQGDDEPVEMTVLDVPGYGIIMPSSAVGSPISIADGGKEVLVNWTGFRARLSRNFLGLNRADSIDAFEAEVQRLPEMSYNFLAADASGITYRVGVEVPLRTSIGPGSEPFWTMDAENPDSLWTEARLGPDQLPHSRGGDRGWIVTANNDPFGFTDNGRVDDDPFYYGGLFPPGWRAKRIEDELKRLAETGDVTTEQIQALQMDVHSNLADEMLPVVSEVFATVGTDSALKEFEGRADLAQLVTLLTSDWDRQMKRDSAGALAFHAFAHLVTSAVIEDDLQPILYEVVLQSAPMYMLKIGSLALRGEYSNGDAVMQEGRSLVVMNALAQTAAFLTERFGSVDPSAYRYSDMRSSAMEYAYGRPMQPDVGNGSVDVPTDGGESTVNVAQSHFRDDGSIADRWRSRWGPIERQVMSFDDGGVPVSHANFALGNVADPSSPHFKGALDDWVEGRYRKMLFARDEIDEAAFERHSLPPAR